MRKYFLLWAVALMISGTANATTDYAEVTAKATIEVAGTFECSDLNFGTIVVKANNGISTVSTKWSGDDIHYTATGDIISVTSTSYSSCNIGESFEAPSKITLTGENGSMEATLDTEAMGEIHGILTIPANVKSGYYETSFTALFVH